MAKQASKAVQRAAINRQTWQQRMKSYRRTPVSLLLFLLVCSAAVITVGVLALLIGYILVKGLPNLHPSLFAWSYSTENVSMLPGAYQYHFDGAAVFGHCGAGGYFFCYLSGGVC